VYFRIECRRGDEVTDEKFWGNHHNVFVVVFSLVVHERSGKGSLQAVCVFAWGVFYFIPIIL